MIELPADGNAAMTSNHGNEGGIEGALAADGIARLEQARPHLFGREEELNDNDDQISAAPVSDYCSRDGALRLKAKIEAYWAERGKSVMVTLQNVGFHPAVRAARYDVRSDLLNGMPRTRAAAIDHREAA